MQAECNGVESGGYVAAEAVAVKHADVEREAADCRLSMSILVLFQALIAGHGSQAILLPAAIPAGSGPQTPSMLGELRRPSVKLRVKL